MLLECAVTVPYGFALDITLSPDAPPAAGLPNFLMHIPTVPRSVIFRILVCHLHVFCQHDRI